MAAAELSEKIVSEINRIIQQDLCKLTLSGGRYHLTHESDDLVLIGSGGFANVPSPTRQSPAPISKFLSAKSNSGHRGLVSSMPTVFATV